MGWRENPNCVLVAGFAQLPKGTTLYEKYKTIGCVLIINKENDQIVEASFTFLMGLTNDFISSLVKGKSVSHGIDGIIADIESRFSVSPQKAIIQSLRAAYQRYCELAKEQ